MRQPINAVIRVSHDVSCPTCTHVFDALVQPSLTLRNYRSMEARGEVLCPECGGLIEYRVTAPIFD